jgi:hypothetical protein
MQHIVVFVEHDHRAGGKAFRRPVDDVDAVVAVKVPVAEVGQRNDIGEAFGAAQARHRSGVFRSG